MSLIILKQEEQENVHDFALPADVQIVIKLKEDGLRFF